MSKKEDYYYLISIDISNTRTQCL